MGDATRVAAVAVGDVSLSFSRDRTLILRDCLYVPSIRRNLIYVSKLVKDSYSVYFNKFVVIKYNKHFICSGSLVDDLYIINPISPKLQLTELNNTVTLPCKRYEPSQLNQTIFGIYARVILIYTGYQDWFQMDHYSHRQSGPSSMRILFRGENDQAPFFDKRL